MKLFDYEDELNRTIPMPNGLFKEIKEWTLSGAVKSNQHQEFIYSYYWLLVYLWRYAKYYQHTITQKDIKQLLGYNPNEKRLDYLIKKNGVLDLVGLTEHEIDYPVNWNQKEQGVLSFTMLSDFNKEEQRLIKSYKPLKYAVKSPVKHIGNGTDEELADLVDKSFIDGFSEGMAAGVEKAQSLMFALVEDTDDRIAIIRAEYGLDEENEDEAETEEIEDLTDEQFIDIQKIISKDL